MTPLSEITSPNTIEKGLYTASFLSTVGLSALALKEEASIEKCKVCFILAALSGMFGFGYYLLKGTSQNEKHDMTFNSKQIDTTAQDELANIAKKVEEIHSILEKSKVLAVLNPTNNNFPQNNLESLELLEKYVKVIISQISTLENKCKQKNDEFTKSNIELDEVKSSFVIVNAHLGYIKMLMDTRKDDELLKPLKDACSIMIAKESTSGLSSANSTAPSTPQKNT